MLQAILNELKDKRILLLGFGREGRSTWQMLREALPDLPLAVADRNPVELPRPDDRTTVHSGPDYLGHLADYDCLLKSPGITLLGVELPAGMHVTCQTDLFLRHATCLTIGITGTKGKSTTTSLIHHILETAGRHALLMGNIGVPVLDRVGEVRPDSVAVVELSSHQLEYTHASPDIAVLTNLYPEHLDHYASYDHYVAAKMNILRHQRADGLCVYNADHAELRGQVESWAHGRRLPVSLADADAAGFSDLAERNPRLAGRHNLCDALLATAVCREVGASEQAIREGLDTYAGMPHRMEPVGTYRGIRFVDNAIATVPVATLLAIEALGRVDTLIVGGMDRGLDLLPFTDAIAASEVRTVICMPDTGVTIRDRLRGKAAPQRVLWADDMETAVEMCYEYTPAGGVCLLSPTASSYNRYKSFEEKGGAFQRLVRIRGERGTA